MNAPARIDSDAPIPEAEVLRMWVCLSHGMLKRARKKGEIAWILGPRCSPWYQPSDVRKYLDTYLSSDAPKEKPPPHEQPKGFVYFAQSGINRLIKIGFSMEPLKRVTNLATANPGPLDLIGMFPGSTDDEKELHQRFAASRTIGEWFEPTPELYAYIKQRKAAERGGGGQ